MRRTYSTEAIVLGSHKFGEADRVVTLFTAARGKTPTMVKGVRKVNSHFGGRLEPFTQLEVQLHEGRGQLHTLTGADTVKTNAGIRTQPWALKASLSFIDMLSRSSEELEQRPRSFNLLVRFLDEMEKGVQNGTDRDGLLTLTLAGQLKLLLLAGYLPHLSDCAGCGSIEELPRFSAQVGGALCPDCPGDSFEIMSCTLESMRYLIENPLSNASSLELDDGCGRDVWRAIREICRYHLGFEPKVAPG